MLFFLDSANPTGHYILDMSQPVHRVVLMRLLHSSAADGAWQTDCTRQNLRNLVVSGQKVLVTDPTLVNVPKTGTVCLDYLQVFYLPLYIDCCWKLALAVYRTTPVLIM